MFDYQTLIDGQPGKTATREEMIAYIGDINDVLNAIVDERAELSHAQRNYLYRLRSRWQARAEGTDLRWRKQLAASEPEIDADDDGGDPIIASLIRKYENPEHEIE